MAKCNGRLHIFGRKLGAKGKMVIDLKVFYLCPRCGEERRSWCTVLKECAVCCWNQRDREAVAG